MQQPQLVFLLSCLLLPFLGYAQVDTVRNDIKIDSTYMLVGIYNRQILEIKALTDYECGMAAAKKMNRPALIYFNGHGSYNARRFEEEVLSKPKIRHIIDTKFQLIVLFIDNQSPLPENKRLQSTHLDRQLRTIGDYNLNIQVSRFGGVMQPMFVVVNPADEKQIDSLVPKNDKEFRRFLNKRNK